MLADKDYYPSGHEDDTVPGNLRALRVSIFYDVAARRVTNFFYTNPSGGARA